MSVCKTVCILAFLLAPFAACAQPTVYIATVQGTINPASARYLHQAIEYAESNKAEAIVVMLDTPGGLLQSTRHIVRLFLESRVPVIVYVSPRGGQAASAGVFITMAAHIAVMAPGTNIGAAHPVHQGETNIADSTNIPLTKATNNAAAFARTIAEKRKRNIAWAERAVRNSESITEREALALGVVDFVAPNIRSLLRAIDSTTIETSTGHRVLHTSATRLERIEMPFQLELLNIISDPNIAYILLMLGIYGLFFELYNPGSIFPGVVGAICLVLAFYSLNTLPLNYAGIALILIGIVLFLLEIKIVSHGLLSIGGTISLFLGSIMLIDTPVGFGIMDISLSVIIAVTVVSVAFFLFVVGKGIGALRRKPVTGMAGMKGATGNVIRACVPDGLVFVRGEYWKAHSLAGSIPEGTPIIVADGRNMTLDVVPQNTSSPDT